MMDSDVLCISFIDAVSKENSVNPDEKPQNRIHQKVYVSHFGDNKLNLSCASRLSQ